jgi:hypothetical protein
MTTEKKWLTTTMTAAHFGISTATVMRWRTMKGFPDEAVRADGAITRYEVAAVAGWLKTRPPARRRPYKWQLDDASAN